MFYTYRRCSVAEVFITSPNSTNETDISHMNQTFDMIENSGVDTIVGKLNVSFCQIIRLTFFVLHYWHTKILSSSFPFVMPCSV